MKKILFHFVFQFTQALFKKWKFGFQFLLIVPFFLISTNGLFAHDSGKHATLINSKNPAGKADWILVQTVNNVDFYQQMSQCNGKKVLYLKLDNRNKHPVKISWKEVFVTTGSNKETEPYRGKKEVLLAAGEVIEASCSDQKHTVCFTKPTDVDPTMPVEILKFTLKDIQVATGR